jgi:CubicO group peptidase (beta-lactamase class C family)
MTMTGTRVNEKVADLIQQQTAEGRQLGVQVCAYKDGQVVVDTVAGQMGPDDTRPIQPDSLVLAFSVTKGVGALAVHILADRGLIDVDAPVAKYWPAFAPHGKERVTVAQALSHQAGLHAMPSPFKVEHLTDWDAGIKRMEEGVPAYPPGTATGYHAVTWAWIAGGIVQGATGRHIKEVIETEIAKPLGIQDEMYVGIPDGVEDRLTTLALITAGEGTPIPADSDFYKAMPKEQWKHFNEMAVRKACLPSGNGHFTARALAKMYAVLAQGGELDGVRLVSKDRIPLMRRLMTQEIDRVLGSPTPKGVGFFLGGSTAGNAGLIGPRDTAFGHPGAGGSVAFCDPEAGLSVGLTMTKMQFGLPGEGPNQEICDLIRSELGVA